MLPKLFFPSTVIEWNKLDNNIRNSESVSAFKKQILKFIHGVIILNYLVLVYYTI